MTVDALRTALRGVRGLVLDADGVLVLNGAPLPGSIESVNRLAARGIPFRVVTNFSQYHRDSLATWFGAAGLAIDPDRIITGTSATAAYTRNAYLGRPLFVLAASDARREFDGQNLLTADEAETARPGTVAAAVIGDAGEELSYRNMDVAFRLIRNGAELLAMHRNPWWLTPKGPTLDAGGFVVGLEFATGRRARVLGKPSPVVFRQAVAGLAADLAERVPHSNFAMVGDDLRADVAAAKRVGLRGILVLSGKTSRADAERATSRSAPAGARWRLGAPDGVAATLADVVAALD
jgi:HAD superfamily hydrolase (TIGR01458 family)